MKLIGLTGGVGMGKSKAASLLQQRKLPVVDTDALARQIVEPGQPALAEVREAFGPEVFDAQGRLRRDELARRVFADPAQRRQLEAILHPRIRELWQTQVEAWRAQGRPLGVVVIPLLFETSAQALFEVIVCVACSAATQERRLLSRGWTPEEVRQRLLAQLPAEKKMELSHFVVWTEAGLPVHATQLERILRFV
jgi:dephospho-CoA kinase